MGLLKHLQHKFASNDENNWQVALLKRVYQTMPFSRPELTAFLFPLFTEGLVWHTIVIYYTAITTFLGTSSSS